MWVCIVTLYSVLEKYTSIKLISLPFSIGREVAISIGKEVTFLIGKEVVFLIGKEYALWICFEQADKHFCLLSNLLSLPLQPKNVM
jgi:hypothetical protein